MSRLSKLEDLVKKTLESAGPAHDYSHAIRVKRNALSIAGTESGVDTEILSAMCLVHDISRPEGEAEKNSVSMSMAVALRLLSEVGFGKAEMEKITGGIASHSLVSRGGRLSDMVREPETIEEKILFDADKIDALGPVGIARWFTTSAMKKWRLEKSARTYLAIMDAFMKEKNSLYTREGTNMALKEAEYSMIFMKRFLANTEKR